MVFSTPLFLFGFLPIILVVYYCAPRKKKNIVLLMTSFLFYAWGEVFYVWIMAVSILSNYLFGRWIDVKTFKGNITRKKILGFGIFINLGLLGTFKYANFLVTNLNDLLDVIHIDPFILQPIHLPLGISFFTFQAISYLVDVYRGEAAAQKNILNLALYISLFPQLIAGPIVRYTQVASKIAKRHHTLSMTVNGIYRFIYGLSKKMLIANPVGEVADAIFNLPANELSVSLSWVGAICYSLQIYFDFSGYSDMAIGLGRMFGFRFLENFNYPYISKSLQEFWQRWHISLSTWFRDYLYIPLGGNRVSQGRLYLNLFLVFSLCGLWHGASWNFVIWGLIHGGFLVIERAGFSVVLKRCWLPLQHFYTLFVVLLAWVFFRADTLASAISYLKTMFGFNTTLIQIYTIDYFLTHEAILAVTCGIILSLPVYTYFSSTLQSTPGKTYVHHALKFFTSFLLLFLAILKISSSTYNPFIYFRF
jgi:alginate O-acetyltransferase complex protein AlgI